MDVQGRSEGCVTRSRGEKKEGPKEEAATSSKRGAAGVAVAQEGASARRRKENLYNSLIGKGTPNQGKELDLPAIEK
jgi:hypothetical protein